MEGYSIAALTPETNTMSVPTLNPTVMESPGSGDNFFTFFDENSSVVFKGIVDQNGTFLIDPSQFNIMVDQTQIRNTPDTSNSTQSIQMITLPGSTSICGKGLVNDKLNPSEACIVRQRQPFQLESQTESVVVPCNVQRTSALPSETIPPINYTNRTQLLSTVSSFTSEIQSNGSAKAKVTCTLDEITSGRTKSTPVKISVPQQDTIQPPIGRGPFPCDICFKSFPTFQQLRKHKAGHLIEKPFHCKICSMEFNFESNLKLHLMVHEAEQSGSLQCLVCQANFSRLASLKSHLRVHEKEENLVCNECGEEVSTLAKLNEHMEEHRTRVQQCMVYRCKLCGKTFNSQALLRDHSKGHAAVRKELKEFARQKPRSKGNRKSSDGSGWRLPKKAMLKKKRICSVCSKAFDKPSQLVRHFRIHSGEKPFQCTYAECKKSFNQKVTLESHVLACHQQLKPFKCQLCSLGFSQRGNLKSHIMKVHIPSEENAKVFKCEDCACVYRRLATLNHHIARMHSVASADSATTYSHPCNDETEVNSSLPLPKEPLTRKFQADMSNLQLQESISTEKADVNSHDKSEVPLQSTEESSVVIHEVNCVYDDSEGASKRCLLKVKKVGQKKFHLCAICPKSFRKPSDLIRHIRVHTLERPYVCAICGKSFAVKSTLNTHLKIHDPVKLLSCNVCQKRFSVLASLKSHERLHTGAKPFQCMKCGKQFRTSSQRRVHQKTHVRNALGLTGRRKLLRIGDVKSNLNVELPDPLKITSDGLVPVPNRTIHKQFVNGALVDQKTRPYRCTHTGCVASFKKSSHLIQHQRSHTGERPYQCVTCHRNFISSGVLKNHIKTHEGVRAYPCKVCNFAFTTKGSLNRHMATHIEDRLYVCPYCAKTFKTSVATRKHIKVHRDEIVPFRSSVGDAQSSQNGVVLIEQCHQPQLQQGPETPQEFFNQQNYDTCQLSTLYPNEFSTSTPQEHLTSVNMKGGNLPVSEESPCQEELNSVPISCQNSEIIHNPDGTVTLQYTISTANINQRGNSPDIRIDQDSTFDPSIFALQQGESLDLQFLQDSQGLGNDSVNCISQITTYDFQTPSNQPAETADLARETGVTQQQQEQVVQHQEAKFVENPQMPQLVNPSKSSPKKTFKKVKKKEPIENIEIREASKPISEQLYTELKTQPYLRRSKDAESGLNLLQAPPSSVGGNKCNECNICFTKFKKKSDLERHHRIHTGEKPYRCSICGKSFRVKSTRQAHLRTHEEKKKTVSCHVCNNLFSTKSSLRVHLRLHLDLKPYLCPYPNCNRHFRTSGHRKCHIQSHFKQKKPLVPPPLTEDEFLAHPPQQENRGLLPPVETIKEMKATSNQPIPPPINANDLENPENIHVMGGVQLQMDGLQFASLDLSSLQVDETFLQNVTNVIFLPSTPQGTPDLVNGTTNVVVGMLPTQELSSTELLAVNPDQLTLSDQNIQQYIINNEMMSSTARPASTLHQDHQQQTYILTNSFTCTSCNLAFPTKIQLQKHEKTHALKKPFKCTVCARSFAQKGSLQTHIQAHSNTKKEFLCPLCPFTTQRKPNLRIHFNRAHPNNVSQFESMFGSNAKPVVSVS